MVKKKKKKGNGQENKKISENALCSEVGDTRGTTVFIEDRSHL